MFRHQGPARTDRKNSLLAAYLATVAGYVNSAAFVLIGSFTSHVTGNVGRLALDLVAGQFDAALAAFSMVVSFFAGAFIASMIIESNLVGRTAIAYGFALSFETTLLLLFIVLSPLATASHPRIHGLLGSVLCLAMGAQNSLVTRLSGAVVRTTHLTGVVTDLAIEATRWFRFWRSTLSHKLRVKLAFGRNPVERPLPVKVRLLTTITAGFTIGAVCGAAAGIQLRATALWAPCLALALSAAYAFASGQRADSLPPPGPTAAN